MPARLRQPLPFPLRHTIPCSDRARSFPSSRGISRDGGMSELPVPGYHFTGAR